MAWPILLAALMILVGSVLLICGVETSPGVTRTQWSDCFGRSASETCTESGGGGVATMASWVSVDGSLEVCGCTASQDDAARCPPDSPLRIWFLGSKQGVGATFPQCAPAVPSQMVVGGIVMCATPPAVLVLLFLLVMALNTAGRYFDWRHKLEAAAAAEARRQQLQGRQPHARLSALRITRDATSTSTARAPPRQPLERE
jgi:hypothetical protein